MVDGKIQRTTKRMGGEKKLWKCRKREIVFGEKPINVCSSEAGCCPKYLLNRYKYSVVHGTNICSTNLTCAF